MAFYGKSYTAANLPSVRLGTCAYASHAAHLPLSVSTSSNAITDAIVQSMVKLDPPRLQVRSSKFF